MIKYNWFISYITENKTLGHYSFKCSNRKMLSKRDLAEAIYEINKELKNSEDIVILNFIRIK